MTAILFMLIAFTWLVAGIVIAIFKGIATKSLSLADLMTFTIFAPFYLAVILLNVVFLVLRLTEITVWESSEGNEDG